MGLYINPQDGLSKEDWLAEHGEEAGGPPASVTERPGHLPVCWVNNGSFTAAGIAWDEKELELFRDPTDGRPKRWYWVATSLLPDAMLPHERDKLIARLEEST